jgi:hypothetical protein
MRPRQWFQTRIEALRTAASRGATMVEYALVGSLVVVVSIGAMEFLTDSASNEVNNQAVCVSDRPPPSDVDNACQFAPVPADVTYPDPNIVPPTTAPIVEFPDIYTIAAGASEDEDDGTVWVLRLPVTVFVEIQEPPAPAEGAGGIEVRARVRLNGTFEDYTACVTGPTGECTLEYGVSQGDVTSVTMLVINVASDPPPDALPSMVTFTR